MSADGDLAAVRQQVAALFPSGVRCELLAVRDGCGPMYAEELRAVASAVPSRRHEFACGRACAHRAIRALGLGDGPILPGRQREPLWPAGVVGAISHTSLLAGAAVAGAGDVLGIGLDIERAGAAFDAGQRSLLFTPAEEGRLAELSADGLPAEVVLFGAKECVHKALFPLTGVRLDYRDVSVELDVTAGRFVAAVHERRRTDVLRLDALAGRFLLTTAHVITALTLTRSPQ
ncbi:MAG TPA: 4'-phosphopantetheinyl transferase superfamily protein [Candidatus Dormibacteraeota bacterium]